MSREGLIAGFKLDERGGGTAIGWDEIRAWPRGNGIVWIHLDYEDDHAVRWLRDDADLSAITIDALLAHDPRPRALQTGDGLMVVIRGVNSNVGAQAEDMVSLRMWIEADRVISLRHRAFLPTKHLRQRVGEGSGPASTSEFLHHLYDLSLAPIAELVDQLDQDVDALEDDVLSGDEGDLRARLSLVRRQSITLRRHIGPQKTTLTNLPNHKLSWFTDLDRLNIGEAAEQQTRILEELDAARERATVTSEELVGRVSELMDRRLYVLSMIAAISLPLGILTGLLGVNVRGHPTASERLWLRSRLPLAWRPYNATAVVVPPTQMALMAPIQTRSCALVILVAAAFGCGGDSKTTSGNTTTTMEPLEPGEAEPTLEESRVKVTRLGTLYGELGDGVDRAGADCDVVATSIRTWSMKHTAEVRALSAELSKLPEHHVTALAPALETKMQRAALQVKDGNDRCPKHEGVFDAISGLPR